MMHEPSSTVAVELKLSAPGKGQPGTGYEQLPSAFASLIKLSAVESKQPDSSYTQPTEMVALAA